MTYVVFAIVIVVLTAATAGRVAVRHGTQPLVLTALTLLILTVVFDNLIVGAGLVGYDETKTSGLTMPIAPIEDLAYALVAVLLVPAVWTWSGRDRKGVVDDS